MRIERDALYSLQELAEMTGLSLRTLQRLVGSGALPARKLGRRVYVVGADLLDHLPSSEAGEPEKPKKRRGLLG
jgi:DNA binding domain, excisionase family